MCPWKNIIRSLVVNEMINEEDIKQKMSNSKHHDHGSDRLPELYSIFRGEVASLQSYGVFVKIPSTRKNGLVHRTQISKVKIDNPADVLDVGDRVYCKVISLGEPGEEKISLSMKVVNQDNGKDLDENLLITKQEEQRRKKGLPPVQNRIELGAILNTVCRKCGMKGHLTQDCFKLPGEKTYELIPEMAAPEQPLAEVVSRDKKKKKKKDKKHKKKRVSSSEEDSSSENEAQRRQKKRKQKKKKARQPSSDSEESRTKDPGQNQRHIQGRDVRTGDRGDRVQHDKSHEGKRKDDRRDDRSSNTRTIEKRSVSSSSDESRQKQQRRGDSSHERNRSNSLKERRGDAERNHSPSDSEDDKGPRKYRQSRDARTEDGGPNKQDERHTGKRKGDRSEDKPSRMRTKSSESVTSSSDESHQKRSRKNRGGSHELHEKYEKNNLGEQKGDKRRKHFEGDEGHGSRTERSGGYGGRSRKGEETIW